MAGDRDEDIFENGRNRPGSGAPGGGGLSDIMKKALFATIGAVFMTEESVRTYVADAKLPRDIRNYVIQNTSQAKEQFFAYLSKELSQLIIKSDLPKVLESFLREHTIELEAKIRFRANGMPEMTAAAMRATPAALEGSPPPATTAPPAAGATPPAGGTPGGGAASATPPAGSASIAATDLPPA